MTLSLLVIAERFNQDRIARWDTACVERQGFWLEVSLRLGAFRLGDGWDKLARLGIDRGECSSLNLLPPAPQLVAWDYKRARRTAEFINFEWSRRAQWDGIILVGRRVCDAFRVSSKMPLGAAYPGAGLYLAPHPSGLSRFWNDEAAVEVAAEEYRLWRMTLEMLKEDRQG